MEFDVEMPAFTQVAASLTGFDGQLGSNMQSAMNDIESTMVSSTQGNMAWVNPTGALENSIATDSSVPDNFTAIIGSTLPYAHRRNDGFDGADSLGRVYHDQGAFFLDDALDANTAYIQQRIAQAASDTWSSIGDSLGF